MKKILVLGPGCSRCQKLANVAEEAAKDLGIAYELEKITDLKQITALGIMFTPALVVDGTVKLAGRVPSLEEMKKLLA